MSSSCTKRPSWKRYDTRLQLLHLSVHRHGNFEAWACLRVIQGNMQASWRELATLPPRAQPLAPEKQHFSTEHSPQASKDPLFSKCPSAAKAQQCSLLVDRHEIWLEALSEGVLDAAHRPREAFHPSIRSRSRPGSQKLEKASSFRLIVNKK